MRMRNKSFTNIVRARARGCGTRDQPTGQGPKMQNKRSTNIVRASTCGRGTRDLPSEGAALETNHHREGKGMRARNKG